MAAETTLTHQTAERAVLGTPAVNAQHNNEILLTKTKK